MATQAWPGTPEEETTGATPAMDWPGTPEKANKRKARGGQGETTQPAPVLSGEAVDGDTLRTVSGNSLRLYGVDAPELKQQGFDRNGNPVPIGQDARLSLETISQPNALIGDIKGVSYGRPVAPVMSDGVDYGRQQVVTGNALAAPDFMANDPARRFDYLEQERLARQNRRGMHDTYAQTPEDFRRDPVPVAPREEIARFWDTPTPWAGMRPEVEKQALEMIYDPAIPLDQVDAFMREKGGAMLDMESAKNARETFAKTGQRPGMAYRDAPRVLTDNGDGMTGAIARGFANGALPNMLEELGAGADTLGATPGRESVWNSGRRLADIFANNLQQNEAITGYDRNEYPNAVLGSEIAGGLVVPMGRVRSAADLAKFGAAYGAASGLGQSGTIPERLTSGVIGAGEGLALTVLGGKALEAAAPFVARGWRWVRGKSGPELVPPVGDASAPLTSDDLNRMGSDASGQNRAASQPVRIPDRIDIPPGGQPVAVPPREPINSAYPGPVPGKPRSLDDIASEVETWAAQQGVGGPVMLHGSRNPSIDEFDPYQYSNYGLFGQGTYLTDNAGVALGYTGKGLRGTDQSGRTIYAVEQAVKNPLDLDAPADPSKWAKLIDEYGLELPAGATNEQAYKALEESLAADMVPKWEGAEIMSEAVRSMGHDGLTHIGGGRVGGKDAPRHRVVIALDPEQTVIKDRLAVGEMLKPAMRDRDWIDVAKLPPPPPGLKMDQPARPMAGEPGATVSQEARAPDYLFAPRASRIDAPLSEAQLRAADIQPGDVVPLPSNEVGSLSEAMAMDKGRYAPATAPNERNELTKQTLRTWNGAEVPKSGPVDLVGWLRLNGGLRDQGGELSHMGLTNKGRAGMDFVGQEARFGPLLNNDSGMTLDDAALRAWEAGYFPDLTERPDVNTFLDAMRGTQEGWKRHFLPEDFAEIDRFNAARGERQDLAALRSEVGKVWQDKSVPAGPDAPFAPPEAYEGWPGGGPDFAGNINLGKLDTPQDIRRALAAVNDRVGGFDAATRGKIAQAETERLAGELGMTPDALLARRRGQALNAEEALAARQILAKSGNELVNAAKRIKSMDEPGDDVLAEFQRVLARHVAIQEQVSGMTAEAGRALQQFRMMADSSAVRKDVLTAMINRNGGKRSTVDAAEVLLDAVESGPGVFNVLANAATKPKLRDKLTELWVNSLLSGPQTHAVNMTSNTLTALAQVPEFMTAAAIGAPRRALGRFQGRNVEAVTGTEVGARAFGLLQGAKEGLRLFARSVKTGEPSDLVAKVEGQGMKAISGVKGEVIRIPTRLLTAEDELFKGIARRMEINGEAVRIARKEGLRGDAAKRRIVELSEMPTPEMLERSMDYARYLTFQRKLGPAASKVSALTQDVPALKLFLPFVRTPTNLLKFAVERSPAAPMLKEWRADFAAGGARRDLAIARAALGTGLGMVVYELALQGKITGTAPTDKAKARLLYADGFQPYSIRVGDKWYSYKRLDPFSTTLGVAADFALLPQGMSERQKEEQATLLVASIMGNLANKTWLSGVSDIVGTIEDPERNADRMMQRLAGSLTVPAGVSQVARIVDPTARKTETMGEAVQARIPGLSDNLVPKRDVWGREIVSEGGVGPDIVSPLYQNTAKDDPVNQELLKAGVSVGLPQRRVGGVELSAQDYDRYQALSGQRAYSGVSQLVRSEGWKSLDDEGKQKAVSKIVDAARKSARAELGGIAPASSWPGDTAGKAKPAEQWPGQEMEQPDVVGDLVRLIPGVGITSGFRSQAYQDDMRRRGYKPATNSAHLTGSALDLVPPRGKSMGWLKAQVKRYRRDASLLDEGDHLHVIFPDWYSAPALGGAKAMGLRNPVGQ